MDAHELARSLAAAITSALPDALVDVGIGKEGHFSLIVTSSAFSGLKLLEQQRLVYSAIAPLMAGSNAPVHAIDSLKTRLPEGVQ
jgi:stress-induced morphogen